MAGPLEHLKTAILDAWREKVSGELCERKCFGVPPLLDFGGSMHLLNSSHFREREKALLWGILVGGVWNRFHSEKFEGKLCHAVSVRDNPKFTS